LTHLIKIWLLIAIVAFSANGAVKANIASGPQSLGLEVHQEKSIAKPLMRQGKSQISTMAASDIFIEEDKETGLLYAKARYYDPDTAKFLSEDAWEGDNLIAPSLHRYLYAYQNPTVYVDLDGNEPITTLLVGTAAYKNRDRIGRIGRLAVKHTVQKIQGVLPGVKQQVSREIEKAREDYTSTTMTAEHNDSGPQGQIQRRRLDEIDQQSKAALKAVAAPARAAYHLHQGNDDKAAEAIVDTAGLVLPAGRLLPLKTGVRASVTPTHQLVKESHRKVHVETRSERLLEPPKWETPEMQGRKITSTTTSEGQIIEQAIDGSYQIDKVTGKVKPGGFFTEPGTIVDNKFLREDLAVTHSMKENATHVAKFRAPEGVRIQNSTVGPQVDVDGTVLKGGAPQTEILNYKDRGKLELIDLRELE